ncbi:adenylate kinase 7 isoform X3 [Epinephelus fuscoguttatus]|uniref:adenylate kinase 7 isoform X3 n=1 Tax=Epinephelus fuscoguttatus TaxID=293821 RepID=UPI0020D01179|nr:adenylate kinase 7 isoform X3 [Epinephelus fuscoguttatus]
MVTGHQLTALAKGCRRATMAETRIEKLRHPPKRVFINNIDSYASKCIAKFLCECVVGATVDPDGQVDTMEDTVVTHSRARAFHIVGTVSDRCDEDRPYVLEEYFQLNRDELLSKLMDCDVVIYNITQHAEQVEEALWAVSALHNEMSHFSGPKMFILVSTVMTWACSKPVNHDVPFTDEIFWRRRAHPNFKPHIDLERRVVKMGKTNRTLFSTYVVASGLQYGMGEQTFHFFFKTSWLGQEQEIPVFGDGNNIVPTIHINDLACVIQNVIERQPKPYYLLAVDNSNNTMEDIVKTVASSLGPGKIQKRPFEEAFLTQDLSVMEIDSLLVNLHMEAVHLKELYSISWLCESGLVENIDLVVEEYKQTRGLLEDKVKNADPGAENEDSAAETKELLNSLKDSMEQYGGLWDDPLLVKVVKEKLMSNPCRNQGFVLDGFPKTCEQAKELFYSEEHETEDGTSQISLCSKKIMPEFVLCLDASDAFLKDRVMNLPERLVQELNYRQEHFLRRLARYRENNVEDETVVNYFDELDISLLFLEITSSHEPDCLLLMQKIFDTVGQPRNYGPSSQEVEEGERRKAEERMRREAQEKAEEERWEAEEAKQGAAHWEQWTKVLEEVRQQEEELLEAQTVSMRNYLMEYVMPTLTQGLIECCMAQPQDPVDFLAEFLIKSNPFNY